MAATMTSCSTAKLSAKTYRRSCTYSIEIYPSALGRKFYEQMVVFLQSIS